MWMPTWGSSRVDVGADVGFVQALDRSQPEGKHHCTTPRTSSVWGSHPLSLAGRQVPAGLDERARPREIFETETHAD